MNFTVNGRKGQAYWFGGKKILSGMATAANNNTAL